ncbi:MAG: DNA-binding protein [Friedmanniella sp.]|nr:DNA-binding protein [Friedmanniella sp.]
MSTTLTRPVDNRMVAGVCAGIARRFNVSPFWVRVAFVASMLLPGPQILIYLAGWILIPNESRR